ncbi:MAG: repressor LexA [Candidatus Neomarinimicrobiota bacterium]|jgi:repressor LexA|nr:MAG: repressor LexA [Candidatus Neomarinimicrobiota bacterium]
MFLTKRQKEVLDFIGKYLSKNGYAPTFSEIAKEFGFNSKGTVYKHIKALCEKGLIQHEWNRTRAIEILDENSGFPTVPVLGSVAAGKPIEAVVLPESISIPPTFMKRGKHFILKVNGNSMIDEHIADGDFIILRERDNAQNGETVVALIDGTEATVKKYYNKSGKVELHPANNEVETLILDPERIQIQGVVVGVMRKY